MEKEDLHGRLNAIWWDITRGEQEIIVLIWRLSIYLPYFTGELLKRLSWTIKSLAENRIESAKNHLNIVLREIEAEED